MDPARCRQIVAEAIRSLCDRRGLSQQAVADLAGVSRSYMERVVTCRSAPTTDWLAKVAGALDVEPKDLLDERHLLRAQNPSEKPGRRRRYPVPRKTAPKSRR